MLREIPSFYTAKIIPPIASTLYPFFRYKFLDTLCFVYYSISIISR